MLWKRGLIPFKSYLKGVWSMDAFFNYLFCMSNKDVHFVLVCLSVRPSFLSIQLCSLYSLLSGD